MKNISLLVFLSFFAFVSGADKPADLKETLRGAERRLTGEEVEVSIKETETEAGAGCMTPECLGEKGALGSRNIKIAEMCRLTLPAHCQQIKDTRLTTCYNDLYYDKNKEFMGLVGNGGYNCAIGFGEGVKEVGSGLLGFAAAAGKFTVDSKYRDEVLDTMSFFFEQFSDPEDIKSLLSDPILESTDRFFQCLNFSGRWQYVCGRGIQLVGAGLGAWYGGKKFIYEPIKQYRRNKRITPEDLKADIARLRKRLDAEIEAQRKFNLNKEAGKDVKMSDLYRHQVTEAAIYLRLSELREALGKLEKKKK